MKNNDLVIHTVVESEEPYITLRCTHETHYCVCNDNNNKKNLPKEVYSADSSVYYTFDPEKVTCEICKNIHKNL